MEVIRDNFGFWMGRSYYHGPDWWEIGFGWGKPEVLVEGEYCWRRMWKLSLRAPGFYVTRR